MIDLYTSSTPNGHKVHIMLEETGLDYRLHEVKLEAGEQFSDEFLAINPNSKIPAIVDDDGPDGGAITIFESGAILLYLAEKTGLFLPQDAHGRWQAIQWLMFQMGAIGPFFGQLGYFRNRAPEPVPPAIERFDREVAAALRRGRSAAVRGRVPCRRLLHCRHGVFPVDAGSPPDRR